MQNPGGRLRQRQIRVCAGRKGWQGTIWLSCTQHPVYPMKPTSQHCKTHLPLLPNPPTHHPPFYPPSALLNIQNRLKDNFLLTQGWFPNYTPSLPSSHTSPLPTPTFPHVLVTGQWRGQSTIPCGETTQHFPLNDCGAGVCTVLHCKISVIWSIALHNFVGQCQSNSCLLRSK